jgi:hypothetical protein
MTGDGIIHGEIKTFEGEEVGKFSNKLFEILERAIEWSFREFEIIKNLV